MTSEMVLAVLLACVAGCTLVLCTLIRKQMGVIEQLTETQRLTLISVTGKEEAELRRLAMARRMQAPKTQFPKPVGPVAADLMAFMTRKTGIKHKGDRQTLIMGSRDDLGENNAPLPGTQQESENSHP